MSRDRFHANWDANQGAKARVLSSGMSAVGDPTKVNVELHSTMNDFIESLPPPPYPFDVDTAKAARGEAHFNAECATFVRGNILYDQQKVGYVWDREPTRADYGNADETLHTHTYDTSLSGQANTGHEHGAGLKQNEKDDLLEYLKTL